MVLPRSLDETRQAAELGESLGFSYISVADSPTVYQDSYLHQLEVARAAPSVKVGPMVSHVVIRHPIVVGNLLVDAQPLHRRARDRHARDRQQRGARPRPQAGEDRRRRGGGRPRSSRTGAARAATFKDSEIPVSGLQRDACPILIAADGPKAVELSGRAATGCSTAARSTPRSAAAASRRAAPAAPTAQAWVAPTVSLKTTHDAVRDDLGAMVVAMANRAMRGDLDERGVPAEIQEDVLEMRRVYDYGFHADNSRPRNTSLVSERLTNFLIDTLCVWGDEQRFKATLDRLADEGWTGVMFILGQAEQVTVVQALGDRLRSLGLLAQ